MRVGEPERVDLPVGVRARLCGDHVGIIELVEEVRDDGDELLALRDSEDLAELLAERPATHVGGRADGTGFVGEAGLRVSGEDLEDVLRCFEAQRLARRGVEEQHERVDALGADTFRETVGLAERVTQLLRLLHVGGSGEVVVRVVVPVGEPQQDPAVLRRARVEALRCARDGTNEVGLVLLCRVVRSDLRIDAVEIAVVDGGEVDDRCRVVAEHVGGEVDGPVRVDGRHTVEEVADHGEP